MATGWRVVNEIYKGTGGIFGKREAGGGVITEPGGSPSDPFFILDPGRRHACMIACFYSPFTAFVMEVDYDEGDVLESHSATFPEPVGGKSYTPSPVTYRMRKISTGSISELFLDTETQAFYAIRNEETTDTP